MEQIARSIKCEAQELVKVRAEKQAEIDLLKKQFAERFASLEQRLLAMETPMH